jgi:hypothetical protein
VHGLMLAMNRSLLAVAALLCASVLIARAQETSSERQINVQPGREARVGVYATIRPDCTSGPLPAIRLTVPPTQGVVRVRRGTLKLTNFKQCLAIQVPALVATYRAATDFNGADEFALEITLAGGRKQLQHFRVNVTSNVGGGNGI